MQVLNCEIWNQVLLLSSDFPSCFPLVVTQGKLSVTLPLADHPNSPLVLPHWHGIHISKVGGFRSLDNQYLLYTDVHFAID